VLVYIRSVQIQYKKCDVGRDDFLLNFNIGFKKHTADRALTAFRGLLALFAGKVYEQMVALIQSRSLELHYQNF